MLKRDDAQIFVMMHKPCNFIENSLFTPLQCGSYNSDFDLCKLKDCEGKNISELNSIYGENTGIYWINENINDIRIKYVGQCAYRRLLNIDEDFDFDKAFETNDIILPKKIIFDECVNNYEQFGKYHNIQSLDEIGNIIKNNYPDYIDSYNIFKNDNGLYNGNGFVMKRDDYKRYCNFLFNVIDIWKEMKGIYTIDDAIKWAELSFDNGMFKLFGESEKDYCCYYQKRVIGFLSERIFNIYVIKNFYNPYIVEYNLTENTDY